MEATAGVPLVDCDCEALLKLRAEKARLTAALRNAAAELRKSSESMPSTISKGVIVRACNEYDALLREIGRE